MPPAVPQPTITALAAPSSFAPTSIQVLIVEDSTSLRRLYAHVLTRAGYRVLTAGSGAAARELITAHHPDIVLLDRVLPDGDGAEIGEWIKAAPELASTYVIMLSGIKTSEDERLGSLETSADDYMVKPVSRRELLARLQVGVRLKSTQRALEASEHKFRTLAEHSPDVIMRLDPTGRPIYVNPSVQQFFGMSPEEIIASAHSHLDIPDDLAERWYAACREVATTRQEQRLEFSYECKGVTKYVDARLVPEPSPDGQVTSILAVLRDFTERVRAEQAIARLAAVVQQAVEAVLITDDGGTVQYVNPEFERMTGFTLTDLIDRKLSDIADDDVVLGNLGRQFLNVIARQQPWSGYTQLKRKEGEPLEIEAAIFPIRDPHRGITSFVAIQRDLSERRRAEQEREIILTVASALRRASTRDEMAPVILDEIMALFNVDGAALTSVDPMTGEVVIELARGLLTPLAGWRVPASHNPTVEILNSGQAFFSDGPEALAGPRWAGELRQIHALLGVPMIAHNRGIGVLWIASTGVITTQAITLLIAIADMSASALHRVALYSELEQYAAELERRVAERTRELEAANERLKELDRLKSKFVSNVTHELRTPVSNLKLYMSLLQRGNLERRPHYEAMLRDSVDRLGQLIEDILSLSRLEIARYQPSEFAPTDLNAIVRQVVAQYQPQAEAAGLQLLIDTDPDLPLIAGNFNQLSQLITNLVVNGLHFTRQGYVRIKTLQPADPAYVALVVEDTGVGILPDDLPHVCERFYRGNHRQVEDIPGTGLGLAIVQEIVTIHRGTLSIASEVDVGTRVEVLLPVEHPDSSQLDILT